MSDTTYSDDFINSIVINDGYDLKQTIRQNLMATASVNPDNYAEATKIGRSQNVPPRFVAADFDKYKNATKITDEQLSNIIKYPQQMQEWLDNNDNLALVHDDIGALTWAFDRVRSVGAAMVDLPGIAIEGTGGMLNANATLAAEGAVKIDEVNRQRRSGQRAMFLPDLMPEPLDRALTTASIGLAAMAGDTLEFSGSSLRRLAESIRPPEDRRNTFDNFLEGVTQGVGTLTVAHLNRPMAIITTLAQGATQAMDEGKAARAQGKQVDEGSEAVGVLSAGLITSATEMPVMDAILKRWPQANAIFKAVPDQFKKPAFEFLGKLAIAGAAEGIQEAGEGFLQRVNTQTFINPDREDYSFGEAGGDAAMGASVGATLQGLVYLALHVSNRRVPHAMEENINRELHKEQVKEAISAIRENKLNTRDPIKMAEVLKAANEEGKRITLDGTVVQQFYQAGMSPEEFYALAPSAREQFEQSQLSGTDVSIPYDEFLSAITSAPENTYDFMNDFIKVDPTVDPAMQDWDMSNPDDVNAFIQQAMRQSRQEWDNNNESIQNTVDVQIERKLRDMLMNSDVMGEKVRNAEAAATEASALAAYFRTRLAKGGDAAERVFMERVLTEGSFEVQGPKTTLKKRIGTGSAYYDSLRRKVMADRRTVERKDKSGKRGRRAATKTPLTNALIKFGGVKEGGFFANQLASMGITPKTHRKLFKNGTRNNFDDIPAAELEAELGTSGIFSTAEEWNGYAPEQEILDRMSEENSGNVIQTDEELAAEAIDSQQQELLDIIFNAGLDIETATAAQIDAAIDNAATRYRLETEEIRAGSFFQSSSNTETEAFKEWFGDSKVVDADGKPLVVYHGTPDKRDIEKSGFAPSITRGSVYFFSDSKRVAETYADDRRAWDYQNAEPDTLPVYLSIQNPMIIDAKGKKWRETEKHVQEAKDAGHDGIIIKNSRDEYNNTGNGGTTSTVYAAFNPSQIKSINNVGTWDSNDKRIFYQKVSEYGIEHRPPSPDSGAPLYDLTGNGEVYPDDIYSDKAAQYYGHGDARLDKETVKIAQSYKGKPDGEVTIYRAIPENISSEINTGDWVTINKNYAIEHGESQFDGKYKILEKIVKAKEVFTNGDSIHEYGYWKNGKTTEYYQDNNAQIQFNDRGQTIIKLFQGADETSLMHEMGHLFLDLDAEIARQPDAPEAFKQEFQETLAWLGVTDASQIETKQHEQFARGFEAYLYRGEAPSVALKSVFQRMKLWFSNIYKSIKQLGVAVDPQMKAVYDRLLATDEEIEAMRGNPIGGIEQLTLEMLNPAQREAYLRQNEKDMNEAKDKLFRKAYRQFMRQKTEWWKEETGRVQAEVEAELQAQNIYRAIQYLQTGNDFNGEPLSDTGTMFKMDENGVRMALGGINDITREELKYIPRGTMTKEGGIDPEFVADMFGFPSAAIMLRAMQKVTPYKQAASRITEDRMIAKHGDMLNDGTIENEALAMVMAETTKREQIVLKALAEKIGAAYPSDGDFARAAEIAIGRLSVDQAVKPDKYYRAALKAARDYGRAVGKKDWEAAAEAKRREIMNKHLHKLSKAMREETSKTIDKFNALKKEPPKRDAKKVKIDPDYHEKIWQILDKYDIGPKLSEDKRMRIEMAAISSWVQEQIDNEGAPLIVPQVLVDADRKTHYRDMSVDEFRGLRELVTNLETQGRNKRKWENKQDKADLDDRAREMVLSAENSAAKQFQPADKSNPLGMAKAVINSLDVISTKMAQVMTLMDGGDNFGVWMRSLYNPVNQAVIERGARLRVEYEKFNTIMKGFMDGLGWRYLSQQVGDYTIGKAKLTRENMLMIAMYYTGTPATRKKLVDGYEKAHGWDEAHIDRILENMTAKDWNFVMDVRDYLDGFWPETSAVEKNRFGYAPEKQEFLPDQEVTTADGVTMTVRGGYMRIYYDPDQSVEASNNEVKETFEDMKVFKSARSATKNGSMIEQVDGVKRPMLLSLDNVSSHIQETVTHITMAETIDNALKLTRHPAIQETLFNYMGREGKQMVDLWLQDVVAGGALSGGTLNRWLRSIRSNYTIGRLSFRPLTALIQVSGLFQTAADSDLRPHLFGALADYAGRGELTKADIMETSTFMRERRFMLNRDIADSITYYRQKGKYVREKAAVMGLWALQKVQEQVDIITWTAGYRYATQRGLTREEAVTYADNAVDRLQGGGSVTNLAGAERGTLGIATQREEWVKASFPFYSYFNAKYNLLKNTNIKYQNGEISGIDVAMSYTLAMLVEGFVSAALMGQLDLDDDDDDEISGGEAAWGMAKIAMGQYAASVPFLRDTASGAEGFTSQKGAFGALIGLGVFSGTIVNETGKAMEGEEVNGQKLFRQAVDALNVFIPIPAGAINQFSRGVQKEQDGDEPSILDYLVYRQ